MLRPRGMDLRRVRPLHRGFGAGVLRILRSLRGMLQGKQQILRRKKMHPRQRDEARDA